LGFYRHAEDRPGYDRDDGKECQDDEAKRMTVMNLGKKAEMGFLERVKARTVRRGLTRMPSAKMSLTGISSGPSMKSIGSLTRTCMVPEAPGSRFMNDALPRDVAVA
jgi:hypothetical protein